MYSLLIVDDEKEIRDGLSELVPWADLGFELIGKLEDGRDAINYLRKDKVHAILSDIKMSFDSGLRVAQYVYEHKLQTKVILLSGYQEFSLAHEAIKYEVKHYLLKPSDLEEIQETFQKLKTELDHEQQFLKGIPQVVSEVETEDTSTWNMIDEAKRYIEKECHREISLTEVAEHVYLSPVYFSRLFKESTNENYSEYLTRARIRKAKTLLKETHYRIYEICDQVGYKNIKHFYKVFKKETGKTPKDYRQKFR